MFVGPLYMGTSTEAFDVVYDTGSDWVVLKGWSCTNCNSTSYNPYTSTQSRLRNDTVSVRSYGSATLYGTEWSDLVCVKEDGGCVTNFDYFLVTANETGLNDPMDGIMGLCRHQQPLLAPNSSVSEVGPIFSDYLATSKQTSGR
jgi:hypothetical protein